mmetsp:Transcript_414/g.453  ORF Transcript_414/g.453 Transcript_414/m.453 type:complete len:106 (-) Transcript_414:1338-1655(-)
MTIVRSQVMKRKMVSALKKKGELNLRKNVMKCLQMNKKLRGDHRNIIESQIEIYAEENNSECLRTVFNSMKEYVVESKCNKLALKTYALKLMKGSYEGWTAFSSN